MDFANSTNVYFGSYPAKQVWVGGSFVWNKFEWTGKGTNNLWSTTTNWKTSAAPVSFSPIWFNGTTNLSSFNDLPTDAVFSEIVFLKNSGSFQLSGNRFVILSGGIVNNSTNTQRINNDIKINSGNNIINCSSGNMFFSGALSGIGTVSKTGNSTLTLLGTNIYTGTTNIDSGTLQIGNGGSVGSINNTSSITNNANLVFNRVGGTATIPPISGTGNLNASIQALTTNDGRFSFSGNVILSGSQTYFTQNNGGARGLLMTSNLTLQSSAIYITGQVGQTTDNNTTFTLNTSATNGPIILNLQNGETGWWWGIRNTVANSGTGPLVLSGTNASNSWSTATTFIGALSVSSNFSPTAIFNCTATSPSLITGNITLASNTSNTFTVNSGITMNISGILAGTNASVIKSGLGTLNLGSVAHTYSGATSISSGTVNVTKSTASAEFTSTTLTVSFTTPPSIGSNFKFFPGSTTQTYASVSLIGAPGRIANYNSGNSTLTIIS